MREFDRLTAIIRKLRGRRGCPWDKKQNHRTVQQYLLEEVYELTDAVETGDDRRIREELGDVLMLVVFHARIARERKAFSLSRVLAGINRKLVRRHPHVFRPGRPVTVRQVAENWEKIKQREKRRGSILDGIPAALPALQRAVRMQKQAARVGFDWEKTEDVFAKVDEEIGELKEAHRRGRRQLREAELGDALFALVNLARFLRVDPEAALRRTLRKFDTRFRFIEKELRRQGRVLGRVGLPQLDALWEKAKTRNRKSR